MSLPFAPIDPATITALNGGDERALERIFREHFDVLIERAAERLKNEPAAAPRLVASTIRELWEERDGFRSSNEIEGFLNEELRQRARSARARMAAVHRFEKNEGVTAPAPHQRPTADSLWKEIATVLHTPAVDKETRRKQQREHIAHEAAEHIAHAAAPRSWRTPAILSVVGGLGLLAGYYWAAQASERSVISQLLAEADAAAITTRAGQIGSLTLADGTEARLGAESRLVVVPRFGHEYRTASATGSVALKVAEGNARPLELRVGDLAVIAESGEFAVRDFGDESARYVRAITGTASLSGPFGSRDLAPGETVVFGRDETVRAATADESAHAFAWLDGQLVLRDASLEHAVQQLWRWYGLDIAVRDSAALARRLSIAVPLESSQAAIAALEGGAQLKFAWEEGKMVFRDATKRR